MQTAKNAIKSKTINFALVLAAFGAAQANLPALQDVITPQIYGYATMVVAVAVAVLRAVTTSSLADK